MVICKNTGSKDSLKEVVEVQIRTVAAILAWVVVALLIINMSLKSEWIWMTSIALVIIAFILYFYPRLKKWRTSK